MDLFYITIPIFLAISYILFKFLSKVRRKYFVSEMDEFFMKMDRMWRHRYFKLPVMHKTMILLNDPELIHKVLTTESCFEKPRMFYKCMDMNEGLICCKYSQWKIDRKNFSSSFNNVMVRNFIPIFCHIADRMTAKIRASDYKEREVNMLEFTERCTISMILASSFNIFPEDLDNTDQQIDKVSEYVKLTSKLMSERFKRILWFFDTFFHRTNYYKKQVELRKYLINLFYKLEDEKAEKMKKSAEEPKEFLQNTFYSKLLFYKNEMTESHFNDAIYTIIGAGFETTGTATAHCILFLAMYPDIQQKAYEEITSILPCDDVEITPDLISKLDLVDCIMKESLRLAPTIHAIAREPMEDFELEPGHVIKKGSVFAINIYGLHRRKDLWGEDANEFNPYRFSAENFADKQQYFMPFSVGKRNCIGYRYANTAFKIMLIKLIRNFTFSTRLKIHEVKFNRQIALKLVGEHLVKIEDRVESLKK